MAEKRSAGTSGAWALGDQAIGVGRVADDQHLHVSGGVGVQCLTLGLEDGAVGLQQVSALHALGTRPGADQKRDVDSVEGLGRVIGDLNPAQQRKSAVVELHRCPLSRLDGLRDLQQRQAHRRVRAEHLTAGDAEQQCVTDLAGGAGDCDLHW